MSRKFDLAPALAELRRRFEPLLARLREHRVPVEWTALVGLLLLAAWLVGDGARARRDAAREETLALQRVWSGMQRWESAFQPASGADSAAWERSAATLRALDAGGRDGLRLAQRVAQRAERVGLAGLRIARTPVADTTPIPTPISYGPWGVETGETGLVVEFLGDFGATANFLGALPPQAQISTLVVRQQDGGWQARAFLLTRRFPGPEGS